MERNEVVHHMWQLNNKVAGIVVDYKTSTLIGNNPFLNKVYELILDECHKTTTELNKVSDSSLEEIDKKIFMIDKSFSILLLLTDINSNQYYIQDYEQLVTAKKLINNCSTFMSKNKSINLSNKDGIMNVIDQLLNMMNPSEKISLYMDIEAIRINPKAKAKLIGPATLLLAKAKLAGISIDIPTILEELKNIINCNAVDLFFEKFNFVLDLEKNGIIEKTKIMR